jgi:hypothetical protein
LVGKQPRAGEIRAQEGEQHVAAAEQHRPDLEEGEEEESQPPDGSGKLPDEEAKGRCDAADALPHLRCAPWRATITRAPPKRSGISSTPANRYRTSAASPATAVSQPFTAVRKRPHRAWATIAMTTGEIPYKIRSPGGVLP